MKASPGAVVYSSFTAPPDQQFQGYCFVDADYIYGDAGRQAYEAATGKTIGPGHDGCYVSINRTSSGLEIGVDAAGHAKLFYYSRDGIWAFGTSFADLVDHLRAHGVALYANFPQLGALGWGTTLTTQMSSFSTIFHDIRLVPSRSRLLLNTMGLTEVSAARRTSRPYREVLGQYIETWVSRIHTLLSDPRITVTSDLTGGLDSRAVFALAFAAQERSAHSSKVFFRSGLGDHWANDLASASGIAAEYGVALNERVSQSAPRVDPQSSYEMWRSVCLGVYLPVYLRRYARSPFIVHLNGGGGENHRQFYAPGTMDTLLKSHLRRGRAHYFYEWRREVDTAMRILSERDPDVPQPIAHYREFRNRFHAGRAPHFSVTWSPLSSAILNGASDASGRMASRQLHFDIMDNLVPGLKHLPYDRPTKAPTDDNDRDLTTVNVGETVHPGRVFIDSSILEEPTEHSPQVRTLDPFIAAARRSFTYSTVKNFFEPEVLNGARKLLDAASEAGKFNHASDAKIISHIMSVKYALSPR